MTKGRKTGGRVAGTPNKLTADIRAVAQKYSRRALMQLVKLAFHAESEVVQVMACKEILDRALGKAPRPGVDGQGVAAIVEVVWRDTTAGEPSMPHHDPLAGLPPRQYPVIGPPPRT